MRILVFGATGMVGDGVLRYLLTRAEVGEIVAVSRSPLIVRHPKLGVIIERDLFHLQRADELCDFDACLFCLGVSSVGMSAAEYERITHDLTISVARELLPRNPRMVFEYISGEGTSANSRQNWARVKARTESEVLHMGFRDAYALRPGLIQPRRGVKSRYASGRVIYGITAPIYPFMQRVFGRFTTSTDLLGAAMLKLAADGNSKKILNTRELNALVGA